MGTISNITLLISFIIEGIKAIKKFIADEKVRGAFTELKGAQTDDEKLAAAQKIASLISKP